MSRNHDEGSHVYAIQQRAKEYILNNMNDNRNLQIRKVSSNLGSHDDLNHSVADHIGM